MRLTGRPAPHLGREAELDRVQRMLDRARAGHGGTVVIRGPSGTGTTRFAHEVAARADRAGMLVLWGRCAEGFTGRPYSGLADALEEFALGLSPRELALGLDGAASPLTRLAPAIRQTLPQIPPPSPLDAVDDRLRLAEAVAGWLARAAGTRPMLLVLDDVQWAGMDQLRLLERVARTAFEAPLLVLLASAETADRQPVEVPAAADVVELIGLDPAAIGALLRSEAAAPVPASVVERVADASGGQPLFARELLRHLVEEGRLPGIGMPSAASAGDVPLPASFDELVAWRTSRLAPESRLALSALACVPAGTTPAALAAVCRLSRSRTAEALDDAAAAGLVRTSATRDEYAVEHDRLRAALVGAVPDGRRQELHRRIAEVLEAGYGDRTREHAAELAYHHHRAAGSDDAGRGVRHCIVASEQARAAGAYVRGADALAMGLDLVPASERTTRAGLLARLALAQVEAGLSAQGMSSASSALEAARRAPAALAETLAATIDALRALAAEASTGGAEQAGARNAGTAEEDRTADDGASPARSASPARGALPARDASAPGDASVRGAVRDAVDVWPRAVALAARADELTQTRLAAAGGSWVAREAGPVRWLERTSADSAAEARLLERGEPADVAAVLSIATPRAHDATARLLPSARASRRPTTLLGALRCVAFDLLTRHGLFREGAMWAGQYVAAADRHGSVRDAVRARALLARAEAVLGRFDEAVQAITVARSIMSPLPDETELRRELLLAELVLAHYGDGDWPSLSATAAADARRAAVPEGLLLEAHAALGQGRAGMEREALVGLAAVMEAVADAQPLAAYRDEALVAALTAAWELGAADHTSAGLALIEGARAAAVGTQPTGSLNLAQARLAGLAGDVEEARALFAREREAFDGTGLHPLRAITDHDEALTLAAAGSARFGDAERLLTAAAEGFERLTMAGWRDRARRLLEKGLAASSLPGGRLHFRYPASLSRREVDVVRRVAAGTPIERAAAELSIEPAAASRHLESALQKLGGTDVADLARLARRHGLGGGG